MDQMVGWTTNTVSRWVWEGWEGLSPSQRTGTFFVGQLDQTDEASKGSAFVERLCSQGQTLLEVDCLPDHDKRTGRVQQDDVPLRPFGARKYVVGRTRVHRRVATHELLRPRPLKP